MLYASTERLLLLNGYDYQPVQKNLIKCINLAKELYPGYEFIHLSFNEYIRAVKAYVNINLPCIEGELTSRETDCWTTLANTASSRIGLKQLNRENEIALIHLAEPISVIASLIGKKCPHEFLEYAWKLLKKTSA